MPYRTLLVCKASHPINWTYKSLKYNPPVVVDFFHSKLQSTCCGKLLPQYRIRWSCLCIELCQLNSWWHLIQWLVFVALRGSMSSKQPISKSNFWIATTICKQQQAATISPLAEKRKVPTTDDHLWSGSACDTIQTDLRRKLGGQSEANSICLVTNASRWWTLLTLFINKESMGNDKKQNYKQYVFCLHTLSWSKTRGLKQILLWYSFDSHATNGNQFWFWFNHWSDSW